MIKRPQPHLDKLTAALANSKCSPQDRALLSTAKSKYEKWFTNTAGLNSTGRGRVNEMVTLLNTYKDELEVDLIAKQGSAFLKRQKGQMKLDNSVIEEFLPHLVHPDILQGLNHTAFSVGPQKAFMSLSFMPRSFGHLKQTPEVVLKVKDQDFAIGSTVHYKFSSSPDFSPKETTAGNFALAVLAAECKVNLDKTMFQEAAGTAARLKLGCPVAKYYLIVEYLDMTPEDTRLTAIDNVFLLRKTKRFSSEKRSSAEEVALQHRDFPISSDVVWNFVQEIQNFVDAVWYDPGAALQRGSFV